MVMGLSTPTPFWWTQSIWHFVCTSLGNHFSMAIKICLFVFVVQYCLDCHVIPFPLWTVAVGTDRTWGWHRAVQGGGGHDGETGLHLVPPCHLWVVSGHQQNLSGDHQGAHHQNWTGTGWKQRGPGELQGKSYCCTHQLTCQSSLATLTILRVWVNCCTDKLTCQTLLLLWSIHMSEFIAAHINSPVRIYCCTHQLAHQSFVRALINLHVTVYCYFYQLTLQSYVRALINLYVRVYCYSHQLTHQSYDRALINLHVTVYCYSHQLMFRVMSEHSSTCMSQFIATLINSCSELCQSAHQLACQKSLQHPSTCMSEVIATLINSHIRVMSEHSSTCMSEFIATLINSCSELCQSTHQLACQKSLQHSSTCMSQFIATLINCTSECIAALTSSCVRVCLCTHQLLFILHSATYTSEFIAALNTSHISYCCSHQLLRGSLLLCFIATALSC